MPSLQEPYPLLFRLYTSRHYILNMTPTGAPFTSKIAGKIASEATASTATCPSVYHAATGLHEISTD